MFEPRLQLDVLHKKRGKLESQLQRFQNEEKLSISDTCHQNCHQNFAKYCHNTTLHGLKYIADRRISRAERFYFAFMFLLVMILSAYFISNVWSKWHRSPLIVSLGTPGTSVTEFPFPAVTICNLNQVQKSAVAKIPRTSEKYSVVQSICRFSVDESVKNNIPGTWNIYRSVLAKVAQPCDQMIVACRFGGLVANCTDIFNSVLTDGGLCCIFNGVHRKFMMNYTYNRSENFFNNDFLEDMANEWSPETGFSSEELKRHRDGYPRPGAGSGTHIGLSVILNASIGEYYCSSTNSLGFKVLLHSPNELPEVDHYGTSIGNGFETRIVTTPILAKASYAVRSMPMNIRVCVFDNENFLSYYRIYSRRNCQSECEMKIYHKYCNCVLYFMPRPHRNMTICGRTDLECIRNVKIEMRMGLNDSFKCDCPYGCNAIKYEAALSSTPMFAQAPLLKRFNLTVENTGILHVYYQNTYYRSQNKEELIGFTEFLSNIGGLLGLFMGFSVFSIIEVIYYLSIRPYFNYLKDSKRRQHALQRVFRRFKKNKVTGTMTVHSNIDNSTPINNTIFPHIN